MAKYSKAEVEEARAKLRDWLKPGDTVYTVIDHVSRSGMSRNIRVVVLKADGKGKEPVALHPNHSVAVVLGYGRAKRGDGLVVGGCGMDMGFHIVHSLGYALWGKEASEGTGAKANALRKALLKHTQHYMMQGGRKDEPNWRKPDREWFGAAGYALNHRWM